MKKKILFLVFATVVLFLVTNRPAYNFSFIPPPAHTNAPGEGICTNCHSGVLNSGPGSVSISFPGQGNQYVPGTTYTMSVTTQDPTKLRWGFETTAIFSNGAPAGTIALINSSVTALQTENVGGHPRQYVSHRSATTTIQTWTFNWTAPPANAGPVTFYAAGNATNNNGANSGDNVYATSLTLNPAPPPPISNFSFSSPQCLDNRFNSQI